MLRNEIFSMQKYTKALYFMLQILVRFFRSKYPMYDMFSNIYQAADLIRSSLLGHRNRQQQMSRRHDDDDDDYETDNEDYNNCVALIQSAMKGHNTRKNNMRDYA